MSERKERDARLTDRQSGGWGTTSATYFDVVEKLFHESQKTTGHPDPWVYAGLPMLIAGVEAFLIEHQHLLKDSSSLKEEELAGIGILREILKLYRLPDELQLDMEALIEIRNQIIHPSPLPFGKPEWPNSIQRVRSQKVFDGNTPQSGTDVLALLADHRLFAWAVQRCVEVLHVVADSDPERSWNFHLSAENLARVLP